MVIEASVRATAELLEAKEEGMTLRTGTEVPLADDGGAIADAAQSLGDGDFAAGSPGLNSASASSMPLRC